MNLTDDSQFPFLQEHKGVFINQQQLEMVEDAYIGIAVVISFIGIITNGLNIKTFLLIGKEDGVTVSLLSLSLSDFGVCLLGLVTILAFVFTRIEARFDSIVFPMDPWVVPSFTFNINNAFYAITTMTTTFLAVARCMCVARPLQFSHTFTKSRAIIVHACFAVISIGGYIPVLSQMGAKRTFNVLTNQTRYVAWMSDIREDIKDVVFLIFDVILTFTSQIVLVICVVIMANSLSRSGKFRQSIKTEVFMDDDRKVEQRYTLSGKELQVIQQVVLISVLCVVCSLPKSASAMYSLIEPEFDVAKHFHNLYLTGTYIRKTFELINSSSTFFIYYKYNSRFKESMFGKKGSDTLE